MTNTIDTTVQQITVKDIKTTILQYLDNEELFIEWLQEYNDNESVGKAGSGHHCPLFHYLEDKVSNQIKTRHMGACYLTYFVPEELGADLPFKIILPLWAQRFIFRLDKQYKDKKVTVKDCLSILNDKKLAGYIY